MLIQNKFTIQSVCNSRRSSEVKSLSFRSSKGSVRIPQAANESLSCPSLPGAENEIDFHLSSDPVRSTGRSSLEPLNSRGLVAARANLRAALATAVADAGSCGRTTTLLRSLIDRGMYPMNDPLQKTQDITYKSIKTITSPMEKEI
jgi:hypothetical protein